MPPKKKVKTAEGVSPVSQIQAYLETNKGDHYNFEEEHAAECQACEENVEIQISKSKTKKDYSKNSPSTNFISRFVEDKPESNLSRAPPVN